MKLSACDLKEHQAEHLCTELLYTVTQANQEIAVNVIVVLSMSKLWRDDPVYLNRFVVDYIGYTGREMPQMKSVVHVQVWKTRFVFVKNFFLVFI